MTDSADRPTVLVVDDEKEVADAYALSIRDGYDVVTAYGGREALDLLDETVDVVLLDRRMPDLSGDDVLQRIRDRDVGCRVIMVTAINPEFDIIGMPFDDYLCKPVSTEDLLAAIDQQLRIVAYERLSEYFRLAAKRSVLEAQLPTADLDQHDEYADLVSRAEDLRNEITSTVDDLKAVVESFEQIDRGPNR